MRPHGIYTFSLRPIIRARLTLGSSPNVRLCRRVPWTSSIASIGKRPREADICVRPTVLKFRSYSTTSESRVNSSPSWLKRTLWPKRSVRSGLAGACARVSAQQDAAVESGMGSSDVGGVVTSMNGPEAGVWVIAETTDLPTKFAKMVVTDERGRYLIPELPKANYNVLVRGYGLVDSQRVKVTPGQHLNLTAVPAPTAAAAAEYYPGVYWYSKIGRAHV